MYYVVPQKLQRYWLLFASYFFYMCWNAKYALLLFASTLVTYVGARLIERVRTTGSGKKTKVVLILTLVSNLGMLCYFKYLNFIIDTLNRVFERTHIAVCFENHDILLPVGISFFIFQALGYTIDVYRGETQAEHSLVSYALFVSFFPQLVAGPIERSKHLLGQLKTGHRPEWELIRRGSVWMLWGLFAKMCIAERCAQWVTTVYTYYWEYPSYRVLVASIAFTLQIYCDFKGYSMMAKGAAQILGIELMDNFRQPFFAVSIRDFWRRWHISLSGWFRDYVYIPLGGSRCSRFRKNCNLMITMLLSGLWHGAAFTYIVWGGLHGLFLVIEDLLHIPVKPGGLGPVRRAFAYVRTFLLVDVAFIFFRANSFTMAFGIIRKILQFGEWDQIPEWGLRAMGLSNAQVIWLMASIVILVIGSLLREKHGDAAEWVFAKPLVVRYAIYWTLMIFIVLSLSINGTEFIYFQF